MLFRPNYLNEEISEKLFQIDPVTFVSTKERVFAIFFLLSSHIFYIFFIRLDSCFERIKSNRLKLASKTRQTVA